MDNLFNNIKDVFIRAAGFLMNEHGTVINIMDAKHSNNVLIYIKIYNYSLLDQRYLAVDCHGAEVFTACGTNSDIGEVKFKDFVTSISGLNQIFIQQHLGFISAANLQARMTVTAGRWLMEVQDLKGNEVCSIQPYLFSYSILKVSFSKNISAAVKVIALAIATRALSAESELLNISAPGAIITKPSCKQPPTGEVKTCEQKSTSANDNLLLPNSFTIRAAGHVNNNSLQYYDIYDSKIGSVVLTFEKRLHQDYNWLGQLKNRNGVILYTFFGMNNKWSDSHDHDFHIYGDTGSLSAYYRGKAGKFFDEKHQDLQIQTAKIIPSSPENLPCSESSVALIWERCESVEVQFSSKFQKEPTRRKQIIILAMALRETFLTYRLHKLPMPSVRYCYSGDDICKRLTLF